MALLLGMIRMIRVMVAWLVRVEVMPLSRRQRRQVRMHVLDLMILMPLGLRLMSGLVVMRGLLLHRRERGGWRAEDTITRAAGGICRAS
jgi:hypothetical protein